MTTTTWPAARLLAEATGLGRREIRRRRLALVGPDGERLGTGDRVSLGGDWQRFSVGEFAFRARTGPPLTLAVHKPTGVVVSRREPLSADPTVFEVFSALPGIGSVEPVGRLDADTSGLLLLTADGGLLHRLTHPSAKVERTYAAALEAPPDPGALERLRTGILALRDGHAPRPLAVEPLSAAACATAGLEERDDAQWWTITLTEGRYHEVRRAFAACGAPVVALVRTSHGPLTLRELVPRPGDSARLEGASLEALYVAAGRPIPGDVVELVPED